MKKIAILAAALAVIAPLGAMAKPKAKKTHKPVQAAKTDSQTRVPVFPNSGPSWPGSSGGNSSHSSRQ